MSTTPIEFNRIIEGIADYEKEASVYAVAFARRIDFRTDPREWRLQPKTVKESGSVVLGLPKWGERIVDTTYIYDDAGYIYTRSLVGAVANVHQVPASHGNGFKYFGETDFLYYANDRVIGRYGYMKGTPNWVDDFLGAEGGIPLNTNSLFLVAASSMYATAADSASLSITGDLTLEKCVKLNSLPTAGNEMVIISKWLEQGNQRSYKMAIVAVAGSLGAGTDGALTIAADTTQAPTDSACTGTIGTKALAATNVAFAANQKVLIHQSRGTGAGTYQINTIDSYTAGAVVLKDNLNATYVTGAQIIVIKQYSAVTVNAGKTWTAKAWDGSVGGILIFFCNGTTTIAGNIVATGKGFRGGVGRSLGSGGDAGEGTVGAQVQQTTANGNGGGGGDGDKGRGYHAAGGGGGNGLVGSQGSYEGSATPGAGGLASGNEDLTTITFGGAGGGGSALGSGAGGTGGNGGGIIFIGSSILTITGTIASAGVVGDNGDGTAGGCGAGGSILLKAITATLGTALITAIGGSNATQSGHKGGNGAIGRIHLGYGSSYTGTTSPTLNAVFDPVLSANLVYHLRLYVSSTGANSEYYTKEIAGLATGSWKRYSIAWDASEKTAYLYVDKTLIGTALGALTAIYDGTALGAIGADFGAAGAARSFLDAYVDDGRVWNDIRTADEISGYSEVELGGTEANLQAYWKYNASASDTTANANNLTYVNTPTYSTDVPFSSPTTRRDIDQEDTANSATYALGTTVDEGAAHRQTFVPNKDPQKSISVNISAVGTNCSWTLLVHDALNRTITSKTVIHADLKTGVFEFTFSDVWTPVMGASYHFHLYASNTTGDPKAVAGTSNNLETGQYKSYYQFLVTDADFHPFEQITNILVIGNGRYVATLDGSDTYTPHRLTMPSTFKVRCFAIWREYVAIGVWRGAAIEDYDKGYVFFWDGYSDTYNFYIEVPEGAVNAMVGDAGTLYIIAGYKGDVLEYTGGDRATKVKRLPGIAIDKQIEILPGAFTMWQTLLRVGAGVTDSANFEQGIYTYGKLNESYPDSMTYDHFISTGTTKSTGVKIGLLLPVEKKLLVGWKDNVSYGLDSIDLADDPVESGSIEFPIQDNGSVSKEKLLDLIRTDFRPLISGQSVGMQYKLDRGTWSAEEIEDDADAAKLRVQLGGSFAKQNRHKEYQLRVNLYTTVSTSPKVISAVALENGLTEEEVI